MLFRSARHSGTTTLEIKSGYGLDIATEKKILTVAREFTTETTFLGAHVVPKDAKSRDEYVSLVKGEMLDACVDLAKWIDVFCDSSAFTVDEARDILKTGMAKGLRGRIHGNQLGDTGGADLAAELNLASVDHCTHVSDLKSTRLNSSHSSVSRMPSSA